MPANACSPPTHPPLSGDPTPINPEPLRLRGAPDLVRKSTPEARKKIGMGLARRVQPVDTEAVHVTYAVPSAPLPEEPGSNLYERWLASDNRAQTTHTATPAAPERRARPGEMGSGSTVTDRKGAACIERAELPASIYANAAAPLASDVGLTASTPGCTIRVQVSRRCAVRIGPVFTGVSDDRQGHAGQLRRGADCYGNEPYEGIGSSPG
jgi:hypothetical protein